MPLDIFVSVFLLTEAYRSIHIHDFSRFLSYRPTFSTASHSSRFNIHHRDFLLTEPTASTSRDLTYYSRIQSPRDLQSWRPVYCHRQAQRLRRRVRGRGGWRSVLGSEGFVLGFEGGRERFVFGGGKGLCAAYLREGGWAEEGFKGGGGGGWRFAGSGGASSPNRGDGRDGGALAAVAHSRQRSNLVIPLSRDLLSWWRLRRSDCPVMLQGESYSAGCICRGYRDGLLGLGSCWHLRADKINLKSLDAQLLLFWMIFFHFLDAQVVWSSIWRTKIL
ncbi:uncharacterized protein LOC108337099 isoform X2 [Vigna angularis]|uniref:uncharacterized protein LOC108337099 isoform X2 n=1 Tax=Phaseolus angularis TaxID=3914 RepID=UPI0022B49662|nr:uncharacterized protein LOC108337099 isoform X2 [Vigna angularis]